MSQVEPNQRSTTGDNHTICPSCGTIVNRGQKIIKGILKGIGFFLLIPFAGLLAALILGPGAVGQNRFFLTIAWVALGFPLAGKAFIDGFDRACPTCGSNAMVALSSPEGQRLKTERPRESALTGHTGKVTALVALNDGRLASAAGDHTVRVWDLTGNSDPVVLTGHQDTVTALTVLADGRLASGSKDKTVRVWDVSASTEPVVLTGQTDDVKALAGLPDGRVASAGKHQLRLYDPSQPGDTGVTYDLGKFHPETLAALPDGRIVVGGFEGLEIVDPSKAGQPTKRSIGPVQALAVLPDGRLAWGGSALTFHVFQLDAPAAQEVFKGGAAGEHDSIGALAVLPDGRVAAYERRLEGASTVRFWDLTRKTQPVVIPSGASVLAALPDGRVATSTHEKTIHLWDVPAAGPTG